MAMNKDTIGELIGMWLEQENNIEFHARGKEISENTLAAIHDEIRAEFGDSDAEVFHDGRYYSMTEDGLVSNLISGKLDQIRNEYRSVNPDLSMDAMKEINTIQIGSEI